MSITWSENNATEEAVNAATHWGGFLLSIPAIMVLGNFSDSEHPDQFIAVMVYGVTLSAMYLFSALSHAVRPPKARDIVRSIDQGVIYTLISGTFTPFICAYLMGWSKLLLLVGVWLAAAVGFYSKVFAKHRIDNMTSVWYILLGWIPALILFPAVPLNCFLMMMLGGVLYTVGVAFLKNDHIAWYFHAIWHILVIAASACHFATVLIFCTPSN